MIFFSTNNPILADLVNFLARDTIFIYNIEEEARPRDPSVDIFFINLFDHCLDAPQQTSRMSIWKDKRVCSAPQQINSLLFSLSRLIAFYSLTL